MIIKRIIITIIKTYRFLISPIFSINSCKFYPSCSTYCIDAIKINGYYGIIQGFYRIIRCNPFSHGGYDPVKVIKNKV